MQLTQLELQKFSDGLKKQQPPLTPENLIRIADCLADESLDISGASPTARDIIVGTLKSLDDFNLARLDQLPSPFKRLLLSYLAHDLAVGESAEWVLTALRAALLDQAHMNGHLNGFGAELAAAMAVFCFGTEYVFAETDKETAAVGHLERAIDLGLIALLGCYRPLHVFKHAANIAQMSVSPLFDKMVDVHVREPREEQRLRAQIPRLSPISDSVSQAVRQMYEENPYPRWKRLPAQIVPRDTSPRRILVAGCGSGKHTVIIAKTFPAAEVIGLDLSLSSLAYAMRKSQEFGIANVRFVQGDILNVTALGMRFDYIACVGVLHHLENPVNGLVQLNEVLESNGQIELGLYPESRRASVKAGIELREQLQLKPNIEGIRALREKIRALPAEHLARGVIGESDFYTTSGCRDMLFHVQEHRYTPAQIEDLLSRSGLKLNSLKCKGLVEQFRAELPGRELTDLSAWEAFEKRHPGCFSPMYMLVVSR